MQCSGWAAFTAAAKRAWSRSRGEAWVMVGLVIVLAALNLFLGFCAGCFVYYQLSKLGVPGFDRRPMGQGG